MQIRAGRANESVLVKRLSDKYSKEIQSTMGLKTHDGPYTFKEFEKYLYSKYDFQYYFHLEMMCATKYIIYIIRYN